MGEDEEAVGGRRSATSGIAVLEEETEKNDRMIQMRVALDYLAELIDPKHKDAFIRAERAARAQGWEMVAVVPAEGRIEATETTRWFGFKDDVVIRVRPAAAGSRVDVRSVSRVGRGDVGTNARRVRAFLEALRG